MGLSFKGERDKRTVIPRSALRDQAAVSEIFGAIILIGIMAAAVGIIGVVLWSQPSPQKLPVFTALITNQSCTVFVKHDGGDTIARNSIRIFVDGFNQTGNFTKVGASGTWTTWAVGDTLTYTPVPCSSPPQKVDVLYNDGTNSVPVSSEFFGSFPSSGVTIPQVPPPAVADFNAAPLSGISPLAVSFTDTSTGPPDSWSWTFGDIGMGNTSSSQSPTHTYSNPGTYSVNLTVTSFEGINTLIKTNYITVYPPPPVAGFFGTPVSGAPGLVVSFTDTSTGSPTDWNWTFGDIGAANTSTSQNPSHTYSTAGTYSVTLTAANAGGNNTLTRTGYITVVVPPVANFTGAPTSGRAPLTVSFTDTSTNSPTGWNWTFGDIGAGNTSTSQNPSHIYTTPGTYSVNLTVTNLGGNSSLVRTNYIYVPVCFFDNFNDNSISTNWTFVGGTTWAEVGGVLSQTSAATADPKKAIISNSSLTFSPNYTITAKVRIDSWIDGDMARGGVSLYTNTADGNGFNLLFHTNHNSLQFLNDKVAWSPTTYSYTFTNSNWYWFKLNMTGGTLYGKVWQDGGTEPSTWPYSWTPAARTGTVYPALNGGSADATVYSTDSFDDVLVCAN
jgi:PKD repeat protein